MSSRKARAFPSLSRRKPPGSDPGAAGAGHIQLGSHMVPFRARTDSYEGLTLDFDDAAGRVDNLWACMPACDEFVGARRSKHSAVRLGSGIIIFGGDDGRKMLNDILRFDLHEHSWSRAAIAGTPPSPRYYHSAVVHQRTMFVFGGYTGDLYSNSNLENKNDLHICQFDKSQWREILFEDEAPRPRPRSAHGAVVFGDHMYIFAGFDGQDRLNDMWRISCTDPTPQWEEVEQLGTHPPTCCNSPLVVAGDYMYAFSGHSGKETTNSLFRFHFPTKVWELVHSRHLLYGGLPPPPRRFGHTMSYHNEQLYVFGGTADNTLPAQLYRFNLQTHLWQLVAPAADSSPPTGRCFHSAVVAENSMYIFGGTVDFQQNVRSSEMFRFQLDMVPRCTLADDFLQLFLDEELADVAFAVGPKADLVYAHGSIVAARSAVLREHLRQAAHERQKKNAAELENAPKKNGDEEDEEAPSACPQGNLLTSRDPLVITARELAAVSPGVFITTLKFVYADRLFTDRADDEMDEATMQLLLDVYNLSVVLQIPRLDHLCVRWIKHSVNVENVLFVLGLVSSRRLDTLREFLLKFCVQENNYKRLVMSKHFESIEQALMVEIIRRRETQQHERTLTKTLLDVEDDSESELGEPHDLPSDLASFLTGPMGAEFADVAFFLDAEVICAHKVILASRSNYFRAMFRSGMRESLTGQLRVAIGEVVPTPQAFFSLLRYIYFGDTVMPPEDSLYLFSAPMFYGFTNNRLQAICKRNLELNVSTKNVFGILEAADGIGALEMKKRALNIICHNFVKVERLPTMRCLSKDLLLEILDAMAEFMQSCQPKVYQ